MYYLGGAPLAVASVAGLSLAGLPVGGGDLVRSIPPRATADGYKPKR